jgi:SAM-dependent methyltransferase
MAAQIVATTMETLPMHETLNEPLYADAEFYDRLMSDPDSSADVAFYSSIAGSTPASILELGCGTGRLLLPLARAGYVMTGIDNVPGMLTVARRKAGDAGMAAGLLLADVRQFELDAKFRLIFFAHNSIGHLHTLNDLQACLRCVRAHLADDGLFVIDMFNPMPRLLAVAPEVRGRIGGFVGPAGERVEVTETSRYDDATQMLHRVWHLTPASGQETSVAFKTRVMFPQELDSLLHLNGFSVRAKYGNFAKEAFTTGSAQQLIVCRKTAA